MDKRTQGKDSREGLKGRIKAFLNHSGPVAAPKRFVLGCRQRAGAVSGELLIPRGADPGVPTPRLAWKVSKSLISCSAPPGLGLHPSPGDLGLPTTAGRL